jgi:hypothetical protein
MLVLTEDARITAGIVLLTIVGIESGGLYLLQMFRADPGLTSFQISFFRAGHAHAGVLVILGLLCVLLTSATELTGVLAWIAGTGVLVAAILLPAGFFVSAMGAGRTAPNRWVVLLPLGAVSLAAGVVTLGFGLIF